MLRRTLLSVAVLASLAAPALAGDLLTGGVPLVSTNVANNTNVAGGIGNTANQSVFQSQNGAFGPSRFGRGGSVTSNDASNTNVAAGLFNSANQSVIQSQGGSFGKGSTFNAANNTNAAAGIGNVANQGVFQQQGGSVGFPVFPLSRR
jgi:hypothetical protein